MAEDRIFAVWVIISVVTSSALLVWLIFSI
jgi:hypothetical protein